MDYAFIMAGLQILRYYAKISSTISSQLRKNCVLVISSFNDFKGLDLANLLQFFLLPLANKPSEEDFMTDLYTMLCKLGYATNFMSKQSLDEVVADAEATGTGFSVVDEEPTSIDYSNWEPNLEQMAKEAREDMEWAEATRLQAATVPLVETVPLADDGSEFSKEAILEGIMDGTFPSTDWSDMEWVDENHLEQNHACCYWTTSGDSPVMVDEATQSDLIRHTLDGYDGETKNSEPDYEDNGLAFNSMYHWNKDTNRYEVAKDGSSTAHMAHGKIAREIRIDCLMAVLNGIDKDCERASKAARVAGCSNAKRYAKQARNELAWLMYAWNSVVSGFNIASYTKRRQMCQVLQSGTDYWLSKAQFEALSKRRSQILGRWSIITGLTINQALSINEQMKAMFGITNVQPREVSKAKMIEQVLASRKQKEVKLVQQLTLADFQPKSEEQAEWASEAYSY
jgi:hypothetical protein